MKMKQMAKDIYFLVNPYGTKKFEKSFKMNFKNTI